MNYKLFFILLLLSKFCFSTNPLRKDSLETLLLTVNDQEKLNIYPELIDIYMPLSLKTAKKYTLDFFFLANKLNDTAAIATCYRQFGAIKMWAEENDSAIIYFYKSLELLNKINDLNSIASTKSNIATVFYSQGEYDKALKLFNEVLDDFIKLNAIKEQAIVYNNIGKVFQAKKEYKNALKCFFKSIELKDKKLDELSIAYTLSNIGHTYSNCGENLLASKYLTEALDILNYYDDQYSIAITSFYLGEHYVLISDYENADIYLQRSINIASSYDYNSILKDSYLLLSKLHEQHENFKESLKYYKLFESIKDTVQHVVKERILLEFQTKYDTYEKAEEIKRLNVDNNIKEEKLITRTFLLKIFITAFIIVCILILIILFQKRKLSKVYHHLLQQNLNAINTENKLNELKVEINLKTHPEFSSVPKHELYNNLIKLIENDMIFIDPNLSLSTLAKELNTNTSYLSKIINDKLNLNFNNFINSYRIKEARKLLSDPKNYTYTIASIAEKVGFRSISVFNKSFKENTGLTPSYFLKSVRKQDSH